MMSKKQEPMGNALEVGHTLSKEVPVGYKRTEVGVIPEEWSFQQLETICDVRDGTHESPRFYSEGVPLVTSKNIVNGSLDLENTSCISEQDADRINKRSKVDLNDILMSMIGTIGSTVLIDFEPDFCIKNVALIKPQKVLPTFLIHLMASPLFQAYLKDSLDGGIQKFIALGTLRHLNIPLPSPPEQRAIVEALWDVDGLLAALEEMIAKKRAIKQAAMQQLLTGKTRLPGFRGKWETRRIEELGSFSKGRGIKREDVSDTGLPCIRYGELYTRYKDYILDPVSRISPAIALEALPIKKGDLLFAGSGETAEEIGICAAYIGKEPAYAGGDIITLTPSGQNSIYLGYLMNHPTVATQKARMGQGDAVVHISASNLAQVRINLPPLTEQTSIANLLFDMDAEIAALKRRRDKTRAIKQGMMQQLLTGRVRLVKSDLDRPGS